MIINQSGGINTSDATATEANVMAGSTFYAQGVKKTGTLPEMTHTPGLVYSTDGNGNFGITVPTRGIYPGGTILYANAAAAGITPEKILQGQSILGVAGIGKRCIGEAVGATRSWYATIATFDPSTFTGVSIIPGDVLIGKINIGTGNPEFIVFGYCVNQDDEIGASVSAGMVITMAFGNLGYESQATFKVFRE